MSGVRDKSAGPEQTRTSRAWEIWVMATVYWFGHRYCVLGILRFAPRGSRDSTIMSVFGIPSRISFRISLVLRAQTLTQFWMQPKGCRSVMSAKTKERKGERRKKIHTLPDVKRPLWARTHHIVVLTAVLYQLSQPGNYHVGDFELFIHSTWELYVCRCCCPAHGAH